MVARAIKRERLRQGPESAFGKAPKEGIGLKVERGSFAIRLRPDFREPGYVETVGESVGDGVLLVRGGEVDYGFRGGVADHCKFCPRG